MYGTGATIIAWHLNRLFVASHLVGSPPSFLSGGHSMGWRTTAEAAIRRWVYEFQLDQKNLAAEVGISCGAICHVLHDPEYAISGETAQRIVAVVGREARIRARVDCLAMELVALCHDTDFVLDQDAKNRIVAHVRSALVENAAGVTAYSKNIPFHDHATAVLIQIGGPDSPYFLIALNTENADDQKRALAHELDHLKAILLKGIRKNRTAPPKSSF